jgi:hypothetical protein
MLLPLLPLGCVTGNKIRIRYNVATCRFPLRMLGTLVETIDVGSKYSMVTVVAMYFILTLDFKRIKSTVW